jgi:hypothetical protein
MSEGSEREMVFDAEGVQLQLMPEAGERLRAVDEREPWARPDRGTTVPATTDGFCPCARCKNTRRRIDGST